MMIRLEFERGWLARSGYGGLIGWRWTDKSKLGTTVGLHCRHILPCILMKDSSGTLGYWCCCIRWWVVFGSPSTSSQATAVGE
jgi:hypothetical protein